MQKKRQNPDYKEKEAKAMRDKYDKDIEPNRQKERVRKHL